MVDAYQQKRLDEGLNLIFRSKNRQIMLSRIHEFRQFAAFYQGQEPVQIITPSKATFLATMQEVDNSRKQFILDPIGERPALKQGEAILILFQAGRETALSQATVSAIFGGKVRINAVDPRTNIRYKTRMRVLWNAVNIDCFERFSQRELTVARHVSIPKSLFQVPDKGSYLVRDVVCELDGTSVPFGSVVASIAPEPGLLIDLSLGGACMMVEAGDAIDEARENLFVFVTIPMPHIRFDFSMQLLTVVRHIRKMDEGAMVHCMFVERLEPETFDL